MLDYRKLSSIISEIQTIRKYFKTFSLNNLFFSLFYKFSLLYNNFSHIFFSFTLALVRCVPQYSENVFFFPSFHLVVFLSLFRAFVNPFN